jgi:D-glucosaminate-6-phosphate ammonia-lyase
VKTIYDELGVRRVINAATTLTVVGGSLMPAEVLDAMREAAGSFVDMHELGAAAGARIASLTRNEAAYVTSSCAAAMTLGTLAAITGGDPTAIARMPGGAGLPTEVVIHAVHRIPEDRGIELAGGRIVEIGTADGTTEAELESALTARTALVVWVAGSHLPKGALDLETTVRLAHARGVPVLVDAAAQLPPVSNLWRLTVEMGADAVAFSGGKGLRGPQASGLLLGRTAFIEAARANGSPYARLARPMKVGKEEIAGLVRAVELYVATDHEAQAREWSATVDGWVRDLGGIPGIRAERHETNEAGQPVPRIRVSVDEAGAGVSAEQLRRRLWNADPRVLVLPDGADAFFMTPDTLSPAEAASIPTQLRGALSSDEGTSAHGAPLD